MMPSTATKNSAHASSTVEAVVEMEHCSSRDEVLIALAKGVQNHLLEARVFAVQGKQLKGLVAVEAGQIDTSEVKGTQIPFTALTIGGRAARDRVPYIGPLPPSDPFSQLFQLADSATTATVVAPIVLGTRTVCLLVGHPDGPATTELRDSVLQLTNGAAAALARLMTGGRQEPTKAVESAEAAPKAPAKPVAQPAKPQPAPDIAEEPLAVAELEVVEEPPPPAAAEVAAESAPATEESVDDRRTSRRLPHVVDVTHTSDHNFFVGFMEDISEGGLFVATYSPLDIGDDLELSFRVPGLEQPQVVQCRVRWSRDYNPTTPDVIPGVGVSFIDLADGAVEAIHRFIKQRAAIFYDD